MRHARQLTVAASILETQTCQILYWNTGLMVSSLQDSSGQLQENGRNVGQFMNPEHHLPSGINDSCDDGRWTRERWIRTVKETRRTNPSIEVPAGNELSSINPHMNKRTGLMGAQFPSKEPRLQKNNIKINKMEL
jgi:hypothetical protein